MMMDDDVLGVQSCPTLCDCMECIAHQATLSMEFSRQEYWSGLLFSFPGDLPDPGIEPSRLQVDSLPSEPVGSLDASYVVECYSTLKMNEIFVNSAVWIHLENI